MSGDCHYCLTDPLKNCFLKKKSVFVCFQRQGHGEGTLSDSSLSVLPLHNKIVLSFQQSLSSGFLNSVRIPGFFCGCNRDWVQPTQFYFCICFLVTFIYTWYVTPPTPFSSSSFFTLKNIYYKSTIFLSAFYSIYLSVTHVFFFFYICNSCCIRKKVSVLISCKTNQPCISFIQLNCSLSWGVRGVESFLDLCVLICYI